MVSADSLSIPTWFAMVRGKTFMKGLRSTEME